MSDSLIATEILENGLEIRFHDRVNRYFGDYHLVRVDVICRIPLADALLGGRLSAEDLRQARQLFGEHVDYHRQLRQMAVAGDDIDRVAAGLVRQFIATAVPYMRSDDFAARFVSRRLADHRNRSRLHLVGHD